MSFYNWFLQRIMLPAGDFALGTNFSSRVAEVRNETLLGFEALSKLQEYRLKETLTFATTTSLYYKNLKVEAVEKPYEWVKRFPILDKSTLKTNTEAILTTPKKKLIKNSSSGSSGVQTVGYYSQYELDTFRAIQTVFWEWGGYQLGDKLIQTGMGLNRSKVKRIKDFILRTHYMLAFNPDPEQVKKTFAKIPDNTYRFFGYASSLYVYAQIAKNLGINGPRFKSMVCWGDKMFPHYREMIKEQFGCEVIETYGAAEGFQMAGQKDLPYMYLMAPWVYMEILDDNGNEVEDGEIGHVVVTSLIARAMPMIRYRIGDLAVKLPKNEYPVKRELNLPLLKKVVGRDTDIVKTPNGRWLIVHTFTGVFEYYPEIKQFRIVQRDLDMFNVEYIPGNAFYLGVLEKISSHLKQVINDDSISWSYVEVSEIPNSPSGKPQIIKSLLPKANI